MGGRKAVKVGLGPSERPTEIGRDGKYYGASIGSKHDLHALALGLLNPVPERLRDDHEQRAPTPWKERGPERATIGGSDHAHSGTKSGLLDDSGRDRRERPRSHSLRPNQASSKLLLRHSRPYS